MHKCMYIHIHPCIYICMPIYVYRYTCVSCEWVGIGYNEHLLDHWPQIWFTINSQELWQHVQSRSWPSPHLPIIFLTCISYPQSPKTEDKDYIVIQNQWRIGQTTPISSRIPAPCSPFEIIAVKQDLPQTPLMPGTSWDPVSIPSRLLVSSSSWSYPKNAGCFIWIMENPHHFHGSWLWLRVPFRKPPYIYIYIYIYIFPLLTIY